jgi:TRAP-type C4-dicarboxylate transport system substrate-binding protein
MNFSLSRRALMVGGVLLAAAFPAMAQDKPTLRFSAVFSEQDIRAEMMTLLSSQVADLATIETYLGGNLFKQGTELVALQRGNLEMGNIAPQDISNQIPAWSVLTSAYLFRDAAHLRTFFNSDVGGRVDLIVIDQADMAGVKLRMPGGDAWQFLGTSIGANPTPMAYAEVYTGLQTGAIDGQDNPLPNVENMKFYEVMQQIVLTSHLVGFDLLVINKAGWDAMSPEQQEVFQAAADVAIDFSQDQHLAREKELVERFEAAGLDVYEPDLDAFRSFAQQKYLESELAKDWPEGVVDRINAL